MIPLRFVMIVLTCLSWRVGCFSTWPFLTFIKVYDFAGLFLSNCRKNIEVAASTEKTYMTFGCFHIAMKLPNWSPTFSDTKTQGEVPVPHILCRNYLLLVVLNPFVSKALHTSLMFVGSFHCLANFEPLHLDTKFWRQELLLDVCIFVTNQVLQVEIPIVDFSMPRWGVETDGFPAKKLRFLCFTESMIYIFTGFLHAFWPGNSIRFADLPVYISEKTEAYTVGSSWLDTHSVHSFSAAEKPLRVTWQNWRCNCFVEWIPLADAPVPPFHFTSFYCAWQAIFRYLNCTNAETCAIPAVVTAARVFFAWAWAELLGMLPEFPSLVLASQ